MINDWIQCSGYVKSVETALIALGVSCLVSFMLILVIERIKLLFYQSSEKSYAPSDDISTNDRNKYLQTRNLKKTYSGKVEAVRDISFDVNAH
jgi:hypothetical protein